MNFKPALAGAAVALSGAANAVFSRLHFAPPFLQEYGAAALARELALQLAVYFMVGCGVMLALRAQLAQPARTLRRPVHFVLVLAGASALLSWLGWLVQAGIRRGTLAAWAPSWPTFVEGWLTIMLWGGLFSWLYLLYLQRRQDQLRLNAVLAERALLAHQLAQAELLAARAHIDPVMVAGVLRQVQARYAQDPQGGAALLDQLVGYLRLALNRGGRNDGRATAALHALREASR